MSNDTLTIDHVAKIAVSRDAQHNNLNVLRSLHAGMFHLATFTRLRELEALRRHGKDKPIYVAERTHETSLLGCIFDWFAISLVSYLSTIKLMQLIEDNEWELSHLLDRTNQEKLQKARKSYIDSVAPTVFKWRDKIAAHRVATDPRGDNLSMLAYSTMVDITYSSPYYRAGSTQMWVGNIEEEWTKYRESLPESKREGSVGAFQRHKLILGKLKEQTLLTVKPWALTETYESLSSRFWPDLHLPAFES